MSKNTVPREPRQIYRVDKFKVPARVRAEFLNQVEKTHHFLRVLPGFIQDAVLEQTDGPGQFNFVTLVIWKSREAIEAARAAVTARYKEVGFDPKEMLSRLGIEADLGNHHELEQRSPSQEAGASEDKVLRTPIGFWLRRADEAITTQSNEALSTSA